MNELHDIGIRDNFKNVAKIRIFFVLNHIWNFFFKFSKKLRILPNENNVVKYLMNAFLN